ncbi:sugar phosphate nucleotidyltransferase [Daejeonella oryzae]|uniref:sugar phosphate nucleotidyltransferase n=1 Tax=Daejeonella oryzae TaxID=1122943 RepID=UPI00047CB259|nr:sugar phosphate nucleotidyltransferase [Daejeonella oryzae]
MNHVLIMAGGQSSRMRASTNSNTHKALIKVFDIPLIELNILYAYLFKFKTLWISVSVNEPDLINYIKELQVVYECKLKIKLELLTENVPLGTIGAVQWVDCNKEPLLILNVDNLLNLNLKNLVDAHIKSGADMTIAAHEESFRIPFGELITHDTTIIDYLEKPLKKIFVSSGTYVLSNSAIEIVREHYRDRRIDVPLLCKTLIKSHFKVNTFPHKAIWTDINDNLSLLKTNQMEKWSLLKTIIKLRGQLN